jgi:hypothetical protein
VTPFEWFTVLFILVLFASGMVYALMELGGLMEDMLADEVGADVAESPMASGSVALTTAVGADTFSRVVVYARSNPYDQEAC